VSSVFAGHRCHKSLFRTRIRPITKTTQEVMWKIWLAHAWKMCLVRTFVNTQWLRRLVFATVHYAFWGFDDKRLHLRVKPPKRSKMGVSEQYWDCGHNLTTVSIFRPKSQKIKRGVYSTTTLSIPTNVRTTIKTGLLIVGGPKHTYKKPKMTDLRVLYRGYSPWL